MTPRRPSALNVVLAAIGVLALVVALGTGATAAVLITGKQIKNGTVTGKDVKNGSLRLADVRAADRAKLRGVPGPAGEPGAAGASAFAPPPSGTLVTGGNVFRERSAVAGQPGRSYSPLGFQLPADLDQSGADRNLWAGAGTSVFPPADTNVGACPGSYEAPTATPGVLCVYGANATNVTAGSGVLFAGISINSAARRTGFLVALEANVANATTDFRYTWAYLAP